MTDQTPEALDPLDVAHARGYRDAMREHAADLALAAAVRRLEETCPDEWMLALEKGGYEVEGYVPAEGNNGRPGHYIGGVVRPTLTATIEEALRDE